MSGGRNRVRHKMTPRGNTVAKVKIRQTLFLSRQSHASLHLEWYLVQRSDSIDI